MADRVALLLRGINVGTRNRLQMSELRGLLAGLGATDVITHLQSGNVVVTSSEPDIHLALSEAIKAESGMDVMVFRRTGEELAQVVRDNPFPQKVADPKNLHVAFLGEPPDVDWFTGAGFSHGGDELALGKREIYLSYSVNSRDSRLAKVLRDSRVLFTARNWTTVCKMRDLALGDGS